MSVLFRILMVVLYTLSACGFVFAAIWLSGWLESQAIVGRYVGVFLTTFAVSVSVVAWMRFVVKLFVGGGG